MSIDLWASNADPYPIPGRGYTVREIPYWLAVQTAIWHRHGDDPLITAPQRNRLSSLREAEAAIRNARKSSRA
jgi:hypothetical protein